MEYIFNSRINIPCDVTELAGMLTIPNRSESLVLFSQNADDKDNCIGKLLHEAGIATFQFYPSDATDNDTSLTTATAFISGLEWMRNFSMGYISSEKDAPSTCSATASFRDLIKTIVFRGSKSDVDVNIPYTTKTPILFIVEDTDNGIIELQETVLTNRRNVEIARTTQLHEKQIAAEEIANLTVDWFIKYLQPHKVLLRQVA